MIDEDIQAALDAKTKPPGSLGALERLAASLCRLQGTLEPRTEPARVLVFGADHGVAEEGVSAFPAAVTGQMMGNFDAGGAAVCVFARSVGASIEVVDVGVAADISRLATVVHAKVAPGTANMRHQAAMSDAQLDAALAVGREAVQRAVNDGVQLLALGEMGIANTTAAAVLTALFTGATADQVTGRGTGLDDAAFAVKQTVVGDVLQRVEARDARTCLREAGGLEIAALTGAMLAAVDYHLPVLVDGYIVTSAALAACALKPATREALLFAHRSAEPGHVRALAHLQATPLLDLDMRLGEGSAATLAITLVQAAAAMMREMASFESAGVDGVSR